MYAWGMPTGAMWSGAIVAICASVVLRRCGGRGSRLERLSIVAFVLGAASLAVLAVPVADRAVRRVGWSGLWAPAALGVGALVTLILLAWALPGDRARGRRRCPKCWYDMAGTPGLVCPECGKDARREARLGRARRRLWVVAVCFVPLFAGAGVYGAWLRSRPNWASELPTVVLIGWSPLITADWLPGHEPLAMELCDRASIELPNGMSERDRRLLGWVSRRVVRWGGSELRVIVHARLLASVSETDESTAAALVALTEHTDVQVVEGAAGLLGDVPASEAVEAALTKLVDHPSSHVHQSTITSLLKAKRKRPDGRPPARLIADATRADNDSRDRVSQLLGLYGPCEESRAVLLAAEASLDEWAHSMGLFGLGRHYPDDAEVQGRVVASLRDPARTNRRGWNIETLLLSDGWFRDERGELSARRRALYRDDVRAAIVDIVTASPGAREWQRARHLLWHHPCFTDPERAQVITAEGR